MDFEPEWKTTDLPGAMRIKEFTFAVYRVYDKQGECLYVGKTAASLAGRFTNHMRQDLSQRWIGKAARIDYAEFPTHRAMEHGEQASIDELSPRYNQKRAVGVPVYGKFNPGPVRKWAQENGYRVTPKGRVPVHVVAAYEAAHPSQLLRFPACGW